MSPDAFSAPGLSPLTRGTLFNSAKEVLSARFIPAHAGNTRGYEGIYFCTTVYPRSRGEHPSSDSPENSIAGLSPLTRGTQTGLVNQEFAKRFIPAHAGNTSESLKMAYRAAVYPRSRGEHSCVRVAFRRSNGLSPLTRGTRRAAHNQLRLRRFIPAHAGNTKVSLSGNHQISVYPRSRGEHKVTHRYRRRYGGLSPFTRGTHHLPLLFRSYMRFIPAHAGNTVNDPDKPSSRPVYPRSRGEHAPGMSQHPL